MLESTKCWACLDCLVFEIRVFLLFFELFNKLWKTVLLAAGVIRPNATRKQLCRDNRVTKSCGQEVDTDTLTTMGRCEARSTDVFKCLNTSLSLAHRWVK